ncbi:TetR/AcrR family transcriptional regulator [Pseudonocardia spinosispora]|uniref:TetR/AcrR family transcriptional regulator n=1 Tax=Pseudonocardia spinosispora TaxID=103441 RepID=UPI0004229628|nr:TetR/AcrR family transcriptional regulator [Pseudonocardia spinosispora]
MGHREELLVAARECLRDRGYARTTARDLVSVSGTNLASIGYHFGSKDALLNEAMIQAFAEWAERVRALALAAMPPEEELRNDPVTLLVASWGAIRASFAEYRGLAVSYLEAMAQSERHPELRAQLAASYQRSRDQVARMVVELAPGLGEHAHTIAAFEIAVCDGLLMQWLVDPDAAPSSDDVVTALSAALSRR